MIVVLEEMDVARRNQNPGWEVAHQCVGNWNASLQSAAAINFGGRGRLEARLLTSGRLPLCSEHIGRWGMGDDDRKGQKRIGRVTRMHANAQLQ